jgi:hypothetical protein
MDSAAYKFSSGAGERKDGAGDIWGWIAKEASV